MLSKLEPFLPDGSLPKIEELLKNESYHLVITKPRKTKLGDFRPPKKGETPKITVNGNLNSYSFLITLIHEIAHLKIWNAHKNRVKPHGVEWKNLYSELLKIFVDLSVFPSEVEMVVQKHIQNPKYSSYSDTQLTLALRKFDEPTSTVELNSLLVGQVFELANRKFVVDKKLRTRYLCTDLNNQKKYRVHGLALVTPLHSKELA